MTGGPPGNYLTIVFPQVEDQPLLPPPPGAVIMSRTVGTPASDDRWPFQAEIALEGKRGGQTYRGIRLRPCWCRYGTTLHHLGQLLEHLQRSSTGHVMKLLVVVIGGLLGEPLLLRERNQKRGDVRVFVRVAGYETQ